MLRRRPPATSDVEPPPSRFSACTRAERDQRLGQLAHREAGLVVGAAVAGDGEQPVAPRDAERGARVAAVGDVGVELAPAGREALGVAGADDAPPRDQQRAGLQQVAARARRAARSRRAIATVVAGDVHAGAQAAPRRVERDVAALHPAWRSSPSGVPCGRAKKPPTSASATPVSRHQRPSGVGPRQAHDADARAAQRSGRRTASCGRRRAGGCSRGEGGAGGRRGARAALASGSWRSAMRLRDGGLRRRRETVV